MTQQDVELFFMLVQDMLTIISQDWHFKQVNPAFTAIIGYGEAELLTTHFLDLVHPDEREAAAQELAALTTDNAIRHFETRCRCLDARYCWLAWTLFPPQADGNIYASARDITAQKSAEAASAHLAAIVDSSDDAIISKTLQGVIMTWNKGAERIFGYTAAEVIGQPITILFPPERLPEEAFVLGQISKGERIEHYETVRVRKDGRHIPISVTISPIRDAHGRIIAASKIAQDISDRKIAEKQEKQLIALSERQRLARDLHDAVSQVLFSANVIAESLPRLRRRDPEKAFEQLEQLHQLTQGATAEMRTLLFELRPENLVNSKLEDLLSQLCRGIQARKRISTSVVVSGNSTPPLPEVVHVALYRIAQEAMNNIARHANSKQARIRYIRHPGQVELVIVDNGDGFDTDQLAAGFGLESMRERAASINASITIQSRPGLGTRVHIVWHSEPFQKTISE